MPRPVFVILIVVFYLVGCKSPCFQGNCGFQGSYGTQGDPFSASHRNEPFFGPLSIWGNLKSARQGFGGKVSDCFQPIKYPAIGGYSPFWDKFEVRKSARLRSSRALWRLGWQTKDCFSPHFRSGFRQAYRDNSRGGSGAVPVIPPEKYWSAYYRTARGGRAKAQEWFAGYRVGAEQAGYDRMTQFNRIASSGVFTSGQQHSFRDAAFNHSFPFESASPNFAPVYSQANSTMPMYQAETRGSARNSSQTGMPGMPGAIAPAQGAGEFGHSFQSGGVR